MSSGLVPCFIIDCDLVGLPRSATVCVFFIIGSITSVASLDERADAVSNFLLLSSFAEFLANAFLSMILLCSSEFMDCILEYVI